MFLMLLLASIYDISISGCEFTNTMKISSANTCPISSMPEKSNTAYLNLSNLASKRFARELEIIPSSL